MLDVSSGLAVLFRSGCLEVRAEGIKRDLRDAMAKGPVGGVQKVLRTHY